MKYAPYTIALALILLGMCIVIVYPLIIVMALRCCGVIKTKV